MRGFRAAVALFALGTMMGRAEGTDEGSWTQPMRLAGGLPVIEVWIGGTGPWRFGLDTGAEGSTIGNGLAARLELRPHAKVEIASVVGVRTLPVVRVHLRLAPGGPEEAVDAAVSDLAAMRSAGHLDGVLGSDVLARYDYLLDFGSGTLAVSRDGLRQDGGVTLPLELHRGRPIVRWPVGGGRELPLLLDSGADALLLDHDVARTLPLRRCGPGSVETNAGTRRIEMCELQRLTLGGATLTHLRVVPLPWPSRAERPDAGLLPATVFGRVQVSSSRRTVTVWMRP